MANSFVGSGGFQTTALSTTYDFGGLLNESGATPTLQAGDLVVIAVAYRTSSGEVDQTPTDPGSVAYTPAFPDLFFAGSTWSVSFKISYKKMGATPDASVTIPGATGASLAASIHVFRGVDATTPLDVTPTTAGATGAGSVDAPAIAPATAGAWIYSAGALVRGSGGAALTAPTNEASAANDFVAETGSQVHLGADFYAGWSSGSFDPAAFGGDTAPSVGAWAAATLALRPASTGGRTATASESLPLTGSATAKLRASAAAAATLALTGTSSAKARVGASGSGSIQLGSTSHAALAIKAAASGALPLSGSGSSIASRSGNGSGTIGLGGSAAASLRISGAANDNLALTVSATGAISDVGAASPTPPDRIFRVTRGSRTGKVTRSGRQA